jgi:hypothetical protein
MRAAVLHAVGQPMRRPADSVGRGLILIGES